MTRNTDEIGALLEGLGGLAVVIEDLDRAGMDAGLDADKLRRDVSTRLAEAGLRLADLDEIEEDAGLGILYVRISTDRHPSGILAVGVDLQVCEGARLARDEELAGGVITWSTGGVRAVTAEDLVRQAADELEDGLARLVYAIRDASGETH